MPGIVGFIDFKNQKPGNTCDCMYYFQTEDFTLGLGEERHSNGSINPLKINGKRVIAVSDGEIYNIDFIKEFLSRSGTLSSSASSNDVIAGAYIEWGNDFVNRLNGVFVIVIYDVSEQKLLIFRDRLGVKPVYYYWNDDLFLLASELKYFYCHHRFKSVIDTNTLSLFFEYGYIPAPYAIFEYTHKVEAGNFLVLDLTKKSISITEYWDLEEFYKKDKYDLSYEEAKARVHDLIIDSCQVRFNPDIPTGITLSGGYDSTSVAGVMSRNCKMGINTFTIGFEGDYNEAIFSKNTAGYLNTEHSENICKSEEARDILKDLPVIYDEPFSDDSAIPTVLVCRSIKKKFNVAFFADGGDHVFAGRIWSFHNDLRKLNRIPDSLKALTRPVFGLCSLVIPERMPQMKHKTGAISRSLSRNKILQAKHLYLYANSFPGFYLNNLLKDRQKRLLTVYHGNPHGFRSVMDISSAFDIKMNLQNCILTKVDRASRSVALSVREPLLDHRIVEFAAQIPDNYKFNGSIEKLILKDIVCDYIPKEIMDRPKTGFSPPIYPWLKNELKSLANYYLDEHKIADSGVFNDSYVKKLVKLYRMDKLYYKTFIWRLLVFQMWFDKWIR